MSKCAGKRHTAPGARGAKSVQPPTEDLDRIRVHPEELLRQDLSDQRALAFKYLEVEQLQEADDTASTALEQTPEDPDFHFVRCAVAVRLAEYQRAHEYGERALKLLHDPQTTAAAASLVKVSAALQADLHELLGTACEHLGKAADALTHYQSAIKLSTDSQSAYVKLALHYHRQNKNQEARKILSRGIKKCTDTHELTMMAEALVPHALVSACMIVKNEADQLPRCLESIRDWVDDIVIVDTGSSDNTVDIARSYGARVLHQQWEGNFSKHRNHSLDQATGDWIFVIDADEQFCPEDLPKLRAALNSDKADIVSIDVYNVYGSDESTVTFLPSIRFFRRRLGLRYDGIVHNTLVLPPNAAVARVSARLKHYGYDLSSEKMQQKFERSRALLESQLAENPDNPFALFNYAQLLRGAGEATLTTHAPKIIESASRAVTLTNPNDPSQRHIHLMCLDQLGWVSMYLQKYDDAVRYANRALALKPDYLDPLLLLGHVHARMQKYDLATDWYARYLKQQAEYKSSHETENIILMHIDSRAQALYGLAVIAELTNRTEQAREYYERTLAVNPSHLEANANLGRLLLADGDIDQAEKCFRNQLDYDRKSIDALLGLAHIAGHRNRLDEAERYYRQVLQLDGRYTLALMRLGQLMLDTSRVAEARDCFERVISAAPEQTAEIAESYVKAGYYHEAIHHFQSWLATNSGSSEHYNDLGNCYFKLGTLADAERWYRRAIETVPVTPAAYRNYGLVLARSGRRLEAAEPFERYLKVNPSDVAIQRLLADLYCAEGDHPKALPHLESILKADGLDRDVLLALADCYLQMGHRDAAILGYQQLLRLNPHDPVAGRRLLELQQLVPAV